MNKLILASGSPRRQEILSRLGFEYEIKPQDVDESFKGLPAVDEALRLAEKKVLSCIETVKTGPDEWILGADTFIILNNSFLGKPADRMDAKNMLNLLSGTSHEVITGLALHIPVSDGSSYISTSACSTTVNFAPMSNNEIEWYLDQNEWIDVAAAYRIQEKGALFIESISGSYSNVMGLPINTFYGILSSNNFKFRT